MVSLCLAACITADTCQALPSECPPLLPGWATPRWIHDAAGIVAGETVHDCATCDRWIACTVVKDVTLRGYHPWRLRPGRWHGWRRPGERHLTAVEAALKGECRDTPECAYLGSLSDYTRNWRFNLAREQQVSAIGNSRGVIVCVLPLNDN